MGNNFEPGSLGLREYKEPGLIGKTAGFVGGIVAGAGKSLVNVATTRPVKQNSSKHKNIDSSQKNLIINNSTVKVFNNCTFNLLSKEAFDGLSR